MPEKFPLPVPLKFKDFGQRGFAIDPIEHSIGLSFDEKQFLDIMSELARKRTAAGEQLFPYHYALLNAIKKD